MALSLCILLSFQNCGQVQFTTAEQDLSSEAAAANANPFCDPAQRPPDADQVFCLNSNVASAVQWFDVICNSSGQWTRTQRDAVDYSLCPGICDASKRPSNQETMSCPAPNASLMSAIQTYSVQCRMDGEWTRTTMGAVDYTLCPKSCDTSIKPPLTTVAACASPYQNLLSGIQNYNVTCSVIGKWESQATGAINYAACPQTCSPTTRPTSSETVKCPSSSEIKAVQNYTVSCQANGTWMRTPSDLNTSNCASPTCDPNTRPAASSTVACASPYQSTVKAVQTYTVSCSGTTWVQSLASRDDSQCPKACTGTAPAAGVDSSACPAPNATQILAKQAYTYTCNSVTGQYQKTVSGPIDYSSCPKACAGTAPASRVAVTCPAPFNQGTAYQNYSVQCNTATGAYQSTATTLDTSSCSQVCDTSTKPASISMLACPSPFQDRMLATQNYSVTCQGTSWVRTATNQDNSGCPVNDCTASINPGTKQIIRACPGGATGSVFRTCSVQCNGKTYSQVNCTADNYGDCSCGANADYNSATQTCVAKVCANGTTNYPTCDQCASTQYFNGTSCVTKACTPNNSDSSGCATANGSGTRVCNATGSGYGACTYTCNAGYTWNGAQCVMNTPAKIISPGQHCDIGGSWGWRSYEVACPTGTYPINPSSVGGCPAGWSQYGGLGCYAPKQSGKIGRTIAGCSTSNYDDECCIWTCSASAPPPVWACYQDYVQGASDNMIALNSCTCLSDFDQMKRTTYIPEYGFTGLFDDYGNMITVQTGGHCTLP